eukprot:ctg_433.g259
MTTRSEFDWFTEHQDLRAWLVGGVRAFQHFWGYRPRVISSPHNTWTPWLADAAAAAPALRRFFPRFRLQRLHRLGRRAAESHAVCHRHVARAERHALDLLGAAVPRALPMSATVDRSGAGAHPGAHPGDRQRDAPVAGPRLVGGGVARLAGLPQLLAADVGGESAGSGRVYRRALLERQRHPCGDAGAESASWGGGCSGARRRNAARRVGHRGAVARSRVRAGTRDFGIERDVAFLRAAWCESTVADRDRHRHHRVGARDTSAYRARLGASVSAAQPAA